MRWFYPGNPQRTPVHMGVLECRLWKALAAVQVLVALVLGVCLVLNNWCEPAVREPLGPVVFTTLTILLCSLPVFTIVGFFVAIDICVAALRFFLVVMFLMLIVPMSM